MPWVGKAVGGLLGFALAGPFRVVGLAVGVLLGHQFDSGFSLQRGQGARIAFGSQKVQRKFFKATFSLMGNVAKIDGRVSEQDIRVARQIMHSMALSPEQIQEAIAFFNAGKSPDFHRKNSLDELHVALRGRRELLRSFVEIQMQAALAAGPISKTKRELLWLISRSLGMGRVELAQVEALIRAQNFRASGRQEKGVSLEDSYAVLGVESGATDKEVKTAYRRLMNQHHPDKLVARGLPQSMIGVAEKKTLEIREAYERVKLQRGFR